MQKLAGIAAFVLALVDLAAIYLAYFVRGMDAAGVWRDGFGRALTDAPLIARAFFQTGDYWPGWSWYGVDVLAFAVLAVVAFGLAAYAANLRKAHAL